MNMKVKENDRIKIITGLVALALIVSFANSYNIFIFGNRLNTINVNAIGSGDDSGDGGLREVQKDGTNGQQQPAPTQGTLEDDDPFLGPENAKVTVVEFSDFECPYCAAAAGTHEELINRFKSQDPTWEAAVPKLRELAEEGKIKYVFRDFPLTSIHQYAQKAAEGAECADEQGKFWEYHDRLFETAKLDLASLKQHAADLGLDTTKFNECLDSGKYASEVAKDLQDGQAVGVRGTPAYFINGRLVSGAQSFSVFNQAIQEELNK
jgi:protein-disulfide isomerase